MRILSVLLGLAVFCGSIHADEEPSISHLPAAVQDRVREWKGEGEVKRVRTRKQPDGSNYYEIDYKERGDEKSVTFAEDGSVINESEGKGGGKGRNKDKDKDKEKDRKDNKGKREKDDDKDAKDDDDDNAVQRPPSNRPVTRPSTTDRPVARPTTPSTSGVRWGGAGQTRYIYWDNIPEPVRTAALAQQPQHGTVDAKALRVQTSGANTVYHVPYERASVAFSPNGAIAIQAANAGGPMRQVPWDTLPAAVKSAAVVISKTEGDINSDSVFSQSERGRTLYHLILEGKQNVFAFSADGKTQNPATYWR